MTNIWDNCYDRCIYIYTVYIRNESFVTTVILQLFILFFKQ